METVVTTLSGLMGSCAADFFSGTPTHAAEPSSARIAKLRQEINSQTSLMPTVEKLAAAKGVSPAQLVLRWALQRGISVVPKSTQPARLAQNLAVAAAVPALSEAEMAEMAALDRHRRFNDPGDFCEGMGVFCPIYD